jgi:hypothetical protein
VDSKDTGKIAAAVAAVSTADQVIRCLGSSTEGEHVVKDRPSIALPGQPQALALAVLAGSGAAAKTARVLSNRGHGARLCVGGGGKWVYSKLLLDSHACCNPVLEASVRAIQHHSSRGVLVSALTDFAIHYLATLEGMIMNSVTH